MLRQLLDQDRILNCALDARVQCAPDLDPRRLGGPLWGIDHGTTSSLGAAAFHGANLIPVGDDLAGFEILADQIARTPRGCSSIVGAASAVSVIWPLLARGWGPARAVRRNQPFLVACSPAQISVDETVRVVRPADLRQFLPAAVAMFTEELGISPRGHDCGASYRVRVADLINSGRAFAKFDDRGRLEFKAEIGSLTAATAQVQGVWVRPDLRGRGIGTAAMAAVLQRALRSVPSVSLYVNDFNTPARRMYDRLGMRQHNTLSTVLF